MKHFAFIFLVSLLNLIGSSAYACGPDTDCMIDDRSYRIRMPEPKVGKPGAIIFNHGYRGTASGIMRNRKMGDTISKLGVAFVAPKSAFQDWDIPNSPSGRLGNLEYEYFEKLKTELVEKHGIDPNRIMVTGFSAGGMMTWELACNLGDLFAGYAPISGTFWDPVPKSCKTLPQSIIHMHGTSDKIVPLKGRRIGNTKQGEVEAALQLAAPENNYGKWTQLDTFEGLACKIRKASKQQFVQFCTHPGGHSLKSAWIVRAWKQFEKAGLL